MVIGNNKYISDAGGLKEVIASIKVLTSILQI